MISNGKVQAYSGQGRFLENLIVFIFIFGIFCASVIVTAWWSLETVWIPGLAFMALWTLAFFAAKEFVGRSDTLDHLDLHGEHGEPLEAGATRAACSYAANTESRTY